MNNPNQNLMPLAARRSADSEAAEPAVYCFAAAPGPLKSVIIEHGAKANVPCFVSHNRRFTSTEEEHR